MTLEQQIKELQAEVEQLRQQVKHLTRDADNTGRQLKRRVDIENQLGKTIDSYKYEFVGRDQPCSN